MSDDLDARLRRLEEDIKNRPAQKQEERKAAAKLLLGASALLAALAVPAVGGAALIGYLGFKGIRKKIKDAKKTGGQDV